MGYPITPELHIKRRFQRILALMEYTCRKCKEGYFLIAYDSGYTTSCSHCGFIDLEKRRQIYGTPEYIEPRKESPPKPRHYIEDVVDEVYECSIKNLKIPGSLNKKNVEDLVNNLCLCFVSNEKSSARSVVFSWVDGLSVDDQHEFIEFGLVVAKTCKPYVIKYLDYLDKSRFWQKPPEEKKKDHYRWSRCEYCGGSRCRWCDYTGVSWKYWMREGRLRKNRSGILDFLATHPSKRE